KGEQPPPIAARKDPGTLDDGDRTSALAARDGRHQHQPNDEEDDSEHQENETDRGEARRLVALESGKEQDREDRYGHDPHQDRREIAGSAPGSVADGLAHAGFRTDGEPDD